MKQKLRNEYLIHDGNGDVEDVEKEGEMKERRMVFVSLFQWFERLTIHYVGLIWFVSAHPSTPRVGLKQTKSGLLFSGEAKTNE